MTTRLKSTPAHALAERILGALSVQEGMPADDREIEDLDPWRSQFVIAGENPDTERFVVTVRDVS